MWVNEDMMQIPVMQTFKVFCERHEKALLDQKRNMQAAVNIISASCMEKIVSEANVKSPRDLPRVFAIFAARNVPMCCEMGDEFIADLIARVPNSSGDENRDAEIAEMLEQRIGRVIHYPSVNEYAHIEGTNYYVHLGTDPQMRTGNPLGDLMAMITEGHPRHGDENVVICAVNRVHDEHEAAEWFERELKSKPWIKKS